jgi:hypothetical protein
MNQPVKRIDLDDEQQWASTPPEEYINAAVHKMLNQMNAIQFVMDAVTDPAVITAIEGTQSVMLEDMDVKELMGDAAKSCANLIRTLKQLHHYAEFKQDQQDGSPPEPPVK